MVGMIPAASEAELEPIVVTERWRGRGIGHQLAAHVLAEAKCHGDPVLLLDAAS
jgi:GNAT superfamily N-acetyltransferase